MQQKTSLGITVKLLGFILILFAIYVALIIVIQRHEERNYQIAILDERLDTYAHIIDQELNQQNNFDNIVEKLPNNLRITLINENGEVTFDNDIDAIGSLENHADRPELMQARFQGKGYALRQSETTGEDYLYHAIYQNGHYIRTALYLDQDTRQFLASTPYFLFTALTLFVIISLLMFVVAQKYDHAIKRLRQFSRDLAQGRLEDGQEFAAENELNDIGAGLISLFRQKEAALKENARTKGRLLKHFNDSHIGIALFDSQGKNEYANNHFIHYANLLTSTPMHDLADFIHEPLLNPLTKPLKKHNHERFKKKITLNHDGAIYKIRLLQSENNSYEISIEDISEEEKTRLLKQEMTGNIAHEIRTPVAALRGYLETLCETTMNHDKFNAFLNKAYQQSLRLSALVDDISLLNQLDADKKHFVRQQIHIRTLADEAVNHLQTDLNAAQIKVYNDIPLTLVLSGNASLIYSIFLNMIKNSIRYAGHHIEIHISCYHQDDDYYYFSFYDTGVGVDQKHFSRLFERFYRTDAGRSRDMGGTGLGLAIVRNAVLMHHGEISARCHTSGGLEIRFSLHK